MSEMTERGYQQLVAQLTSAGWEPAATWQSEIRSMKKQVDGDGGANDSTTPTGLLKQLANLRDAGILTEDEFQTKKAEILKRV